MADTGDQVDHAVKIAHASVGRLPWGVHSLSPDIALTQPSHWARVQAEMVPADQAFEMVCLRVNTAPHLRGACGEVRE